LVLEGARLTEETGWIALPQHVHDLSPDGSSVLASRFASSGVDQLLAVDLATREEVLLAGARSQEVFGRARWSPDGTMVAYTVGKPARRTEMCLLDLSSGTTRCVPDGGNVYELDWAPDGEQILLAGPPKQPVRLVPVHGGPVKNLVRQRGDTRINRALGRAGIGDAFQLVGPEWSASGRYLAALANLKDASRFAYVSVVFGPRGTPHAIGRPSREFPAPFGWSPSSDRLAYTRGEPPYRIEELYILNARSGEEVLLFDTRGKAIINDLVWSPSGRWLALALWKGERSQQLLILDVEGPQNQLARTLRLEAENSPEPLVAWAP
jgi:Tol biopolymer transport system component